MLSVKPAFFMRKPKSRIIVTLRKVVPHTTALGESTHHSLSLHTHNDLRQYFLHNFYFKLQRMLHTLMNLYLNRSARDQG